jgi:transcriptional regulator with XRE-family HTH domain
VFILLQIDSNKTEFQFYWTYNKVEVQPVFGKRLRKLRIERGITQEELGKVLNVSKKTISAYENGLIDPSTDTLSAIASYFEVSVDWLLGHTDIREIPEKRIEAALESDLELTEIWQELQKREDLKTFFKQVMKLSPDSIRRAVRIIKAVEDGEQEDF